MYWGPLRSPWSPQQGPQPHLPAPSRSLQIGDRHGELTARMNVAQLQLVLGRLTSPAASEKPDLAGYEAQGECQGCGGGSCSPQAQTGSGAGEGWDRGQASMAEVAAARKWPCKPVLLGLRDSTGLRFTLSPSHPRPGWCRRAAG